MAAQAPTVPEPPPQKHGVLTGVLPGGKTVRLEGDRPSEFVETIRACEMAWVNFGVTNLAKEGEIIASLFGFSGNMIEILVRGGLSNYEDRESELGVLFPVIRVQALEVGTFPLVILVRDGLILTIHEEAKVTRFVKFARYADVVLRKLPGGLEPRDRLTIVLTRLINENNERNFDGLRQIQEHGDKLAGSLLDERIDRRLIAPQIYEMKHALITYLDGLWATLDVIQSLRYGDAELISDDETFLARVALLGDDVRRHIQLSEHMSEVLASGLEVLQSIYNNQLQVLNNRMTFVVAWLTILGTAVLVPNTLATAIGAMPGGWTYGMPAYLGLMAGSTIVSTWIAWYWVKRRMATPGS